MTRNYIERSNVNIHNGTLAGAMPFEPGLNLIAGENGTLKTQFLRALKTGNHIAAVPNQVVVTQAISPKRNAERRAADAIFTTFRQQSRTVDMLFNERVNAQMNDTTFEPYPSLGELYYLVFEQRQRDGQRPSVERMNELTDEFNAVIRQIFPKYRLESEWSDQTGAPRIHVQKEGAAKFPIEALSLGEQEILSLVLSLHVHQSRVDTFLIDEPEVHLNWHLEERLFNYLSDLCDAGTQAIVVTHSRAIFKPRFLSRTTFLKWNDKQRIEWTREPEAEILRRLAGDAVEIIRLGESPRPTFFVEDNAHVSLIETLSLVLGVDATITVCGNSSNVKSMFKRAKQDGRLTNTFFIVDGDNEGHPFPGDDAFIHLPFYCTENTYLVPVEIARIVGRDESDVNTIILEAIQSNRRTLLTKSRFLDFLLDGLRSTDLTVERLDKFDASLLLPLVLARLQISQAEYCEKFIRSLHDQNRLAERIPEALLRALKMPRGAP